jgi:hypothetical protein
MIRLFILFLLSCSILSACQNSSPKNNPAKRIFQFTPIKGIKYYEVRRSFENGIAFNDSGFQQEPEWAVRFLSDSTVQVYSPSLNKMIDCDLIYSHEAVYNFAREWFRVKKLSKDSLLLQRLEVNGKVIAHDIRSNVYMTFYSEDYLQKINKTVEELRKARKVDSLYVREKSVLANSHPMDSSYFFAARNPVEFKTESKIIQIEKVSTVDELQNHSSSFDYLYPEYKVIISPAYKKFAYTISAVVDTTGHLTVYKFNAIDEYRENRRKVLQGILDIYLSNLCKVKTGSTLGIKHSSLIVLDLIGKP